MRSTVGREIRDTAKDQLRGMRHLVRLLGSDEERKRLARHGLPEVPEEVDRLVGRTFRAVDGVMSLVEAAAAPFRSQAAPPPGFGTIEAYADPGEDAAAAFSGDLYRVLKLAAGTRDPNPLILSARLAGIHRELATRAGTLADPGDGAGLAAALFLALSRRHPLAGPNPPEGDAEIRIHAATALIFGLTASGRLPRAEVPEIVTDALLAAGARIEIFRDAATTDTETDALDAVLRSLLAHLG
ncbi:hypothetical protein [Ensifer soli]|uniref:hypothetical protein n=1 Tax=Ciceribacter sp. sgz301302 TaxID=3342379 RepID=UPI0035B7ADCA